MQEFLEREQEFLEREWDDLGSRTKRTAKHFADQAEKADLVDAANAFASQEPPTKYDELVDPFRQARDLAASWRRR